MADYIDTLEAKTHYTLEGLFGRMDEETAEKMKKDIEEAFEQIDD